MERYVHKASGLIVTTADGVALPAYAYEKGARAGEKDAEPARRPAAKRKPAAKKADGKE